MADKHGHASRESDLEISQEAYMGNRTICITGFAEASRELANQQPPGVEVWGLNRCYTFLKRWDRWFEVHPDDTYLGMNGMREKGYYDLLVKSEVPVYMQHPQPDIPKAVRYPREEIARWMRGYLTNSVSMMVALALYEHAVLKKPLEELRLTGVEMSSWNEYAYQKPNLEYWLGVAEGMGIKVWLPTSAPILIAPMYGSGEKSLKQMAKERLHHAKMEKSKVEADMNSVTGHIRELKWAHSQKKPIGAGLYQKRLGELQQAQQEAVGRLNHYVGVLRECEHWMVALAVNSELADDPGPTGYTGV